MRGEGAGPLLALYHACFHLSNNNVTGLLPTISLCMLGKNFSRWHFEVFFLFFLENMIWYFMQIVSKETICMKCQILFSRKKIRKLPSVCRLLKLPTAWLVLNCLYLCWSHNTCAWNHLTAWHFIAWSKHPSWSVLLFICMLKVISCISFASWGWIQQATNEWHSS